MVGKLLFAANTVRIDIAFVVSKLSRFLQNPRKSHLAKARHVMRYLKGTADLGIVYSKDSHFKLSGFCDSDWGTDPNDRISVTGYVFILAGAPITWRSKKQTTVALSSTEAEYMALGDALRELLWLKQLLDQLEIKSSEPPTLYCDNTGALSLMKHPAFHPRTKHIDIRHHFIRQHLTSNDFISKHVSSGMNLADPLTKALDKPKFESLRLKWKFEKL
ncbi:hypothetical protein KL927_005439 [Ogataea polymorpha]|nr:hypothetical protein KL927_005439 [Ogataea polymorpha]